MTNTELMIMGLIAEAPCYGYQIEQAINKNGFREWMEVGFSSIYFILNRLEKAGWLTSEKYAKGARPARKVYSLTFEGQQALLAALRERLVAPRPLTNDTDLALTYLGLLSKAEQVEGLEKFCAMLDEKIRRLQIRLEEHQAGEGSPVYATLLDRRSLVLARAERSWVQALLVELA